MEKLNLDRSPLNPLRLRLMLLRFVQLLRVDGSSPDMLLSFKWISSNLLILTIESGILPCNLFIPSKIKSDQICEPADALK